MRRNRIILFDRSEVDSRIIRLTGNNISGATKPVDNTRGTSLLFLFGCPGGVGAAAWKWALNQGKGCSGQGVLPAEERSQKRGHSAQRTSLRGEFLSVVQRAIGEVSNSIHLNVLHTYYTIFFAFCQQVYFLSKISTKTMNTLCTFAEKMSKQAYTNVNGMRICE